MRPRKEQGSRVKVGVDIKVKIGVHEWFQIEDSLRPISLLQIKESAATTSMELGSVTSSFAT